MNDRDLIVNKSEFGPHTERALVGLAFEEPEFFEMIHHYLSIDYFQDTSAKYVYALIDKIYKEYNAVPSRFIVRDAALKQLTVDVDYESILKTIDSEVDVKELPLIKGELLKWTKHNAYGEIYSDAAWAAYESREYNVLEQIFDDASKIRDFGSLGFNFFDRYQELFIPENIEHFTTGFPQLDKHLNNGGPSRKELFSWFAATGVGKSIAMVNSGVANILAGRKVLHISLEMTEVATGTRYAGCFANLDINSRFEDSTKNIFLSRLDKYRNSFKDNLYICEFPPNTITVDHIYALVDNLRKHKGFVPDMIIVDYLELLNSRSSRKSDKDYELQKNASVELRALASRTNTFVMTAIQSNRSGADPKEMNKDLDLNSAAESYGKLMALEYVVSLQQSKQEYSNVIPSIRLYIAKNRNGPKFKQVMADIKYSSSKMVERDDQIQV